MNKAVLISTLFLLLMKVSPALAQELTFTYVPTPKGSFNGMPKTVVQDPQGIMWIGQRGLHRYDGYQYISYYHDPLNPNSLIDNFVETVYATPKGMVWIGTHKGLDRFDPASGVFTHFQHNPKDQTSLSNNVVMTILEDREGTLWIGTENGLNRFNPTTNTFTHYQHNPANPTSLSHKHVRVIYQDRQGTLWVGCNDPYYTEDRRMQMDGGLNRFDPRMGTFTRYLHDPTNPHSLTDNRVRAIFEDSHGQFWVGTAGDGLHTMDRQQGTFTRHGYDPAHPQKLSRPPLKKNLWWAEDHITFITEDVTGAIWIGTLNNGLNRYNTQTRQVKHFPNFTDPRSGVRTATTWWACPSRDGMLWIAYNEGLFRVDPLQQPIPYVATGRLVGTLYQDNAGVIWYGTDQGLVRKDHIRGTEQLFVHNPDNPTSLSNNGINVIYQDRQGDLWIGTNSGLNRFEPKKAAFARYLSTNQDDSRLANHPISSIYEDRRGRLWIGTFGGGLNRMNRPAGTFTRYLHNPKDPHSLGSNYITCLFEDHRGSLWVGTDHGGLTRLVAQNGTFQPFLLKADIRCLLQDAVGILWAGTMSGLYRSNRALTSFSAFRDSTGEITGETTVKGLLEDRQQGLWIQGSIGIGRLNRQRTEAILYIPSLDQQSYTDLGLSSAYYKSPQGQFYFASGKGYYTFFPEQLTRKTREPQVVISALRIANQPVVPGQDSPLKAPLWQTNEIQLRHDQNAFSFDFAGIHYGNPERNRHLFKLENLDDTWRKAGEEKTAYYYNVPPGEYVFRVKAANMDGVWAEKAIRIIIQPPWWRTGWFMALAACLIVGLIYGGVRYRITQVRKEEALKAEEEQQKTEFSKKLSEMEMQALRAQMNPHFIFNSLNSINTFILKNEPDAASDYLAKFSRLIRLILQNSNSATVTLQNELEALQLYLEMESLRFRNKFTFQIRLGPEVEAEDIDIPPLLIQPYVENAIWHGLLHKEGSGHVGIDLQLEDDRLVCVIEDDGVGRRRAAELKSKSATRSKSLGMQITSHRMELMNELYGKQTTVDIVDLVDASGEAGGTRVVLTMSL